MPKEHQRVEFRVLVMECCHVQLCWVNPRLPNYCPECGTVCIGTVKSCVTLSDTDATLSYRVPDGLWG